MKTSLKESQSKFLSKQILDQLITGTVIEYNSSAKTCKVKADRAIFGDVVDIQVNRSISSALLVSGAKVLIGIIDKNIPASWVLICVYA